MINKTSAPEPLTKVCCCVCSFWLDSRHQDLAVMFKDYLSSGWVRSQSFHITVKELYLFVISQCGTRSWHRRLCSHVKFPSVLFSGAQAAFVHTCTMLFFHNCAVLYFALWEDPKYQFRCVKTLWIISPLSGNALRWCGKADGFKKKNIKHLL